jgi:hypothetical protein
MWQTIIQVHSNFVVSFQAPSYPHLPLPNSTSMPYVTIDAIEEGKAQRTYIHALSRNDVSGGRTLGVHWSGAQGCK